MSKLKIKKEEIEKLLKDTLGVSKVVWDKSGNAEVEIDLETIKEKQIKVVEKVQITPIVYPTVVYPRPYPIYIREPSRDIPRPLRYWISCGNTKSLTYCKG